MRDFNFLIIDEKFKSIHHEIISEIGNILSGLNADSGAMSAVMSWGDTMDSKATLNCLKDYNLKFNN